MFTLSMNKVDLPVYHRAIAFWYFYNEQTDKGGFLIECVENGTEDHVLYFAHKKGTPRLISLGSQYKITVATASFIDALSIAGYDEIFFKQISLK